MSSIEGKKSENSLRFHGRWTGGRCTNQEPSFNCQNQHQQSEQQPISQVCTDNEEGKSSPLASNPTTLNEESDIRWEAMVQGLLLYQTKHNTLSVPRHYRWDDRNLYEWSRNQRKHYLNGTRGKTPALLPKRIERLRSIGFELDPTGAHGQNDAFDDKRWVAMFEGLREFHQKHGTFAVPAGYLCDGKNLQEWMRHQRKQYSQTMKKAGRRTLSLQRIDRLLSIGFDLDPTGRRQDKRNDQERWEVMVQGLLDFRERTGTFRVPEGYLYDGRNLFSWAHNQRRLYGNHLKGKQPSLLVKRMERLLEIGYLPSPHRSLELVPANWKPPPLALDPGLITLQSSTEASSETSAATDVAVAYLLTEPAAAISERTSSVSATDLFLARRAVCTYQSMTPQERSQLLERSTSL